MKQLATLVILFSLTSIGFAQSSNARRETTCTSLPCEVASVSISAQTSAIPPTAIFTPTVAGFYRVTAYLATSASKGAVWNYVLSWTDDDKARNSGRLPVGAGSLGSFTESVQAIAGQPISYSISAGQSNPPGASFNFVIVVEQLQ